MSEYSRGLPHMGSDLAEVLGALKRRDEILLQERWTRENPYLAKTSNAAEIRVRQGACFVFHEEGKPRIACLAEDFIYAFNMAESGTYFINMEEDESLAVSAEQTHFCVGSVEAVSGVVAGFKMFYRFSGYAAGEVYWQLPGALSPAGLFPLEIWDDISNSYADSFPSFGGPGRTAFEGGMQRESLPNITGQFFFRGIEHWGWHDGRAFSYSERQGEYAGSNPKGTVPTISFDASRVSKAYQNNAKVAPQNETIKVWRRRGVLTGETSVFYEYDALGELVKEYTLQRDEAGFIGYNPNRMTDVAPPAGRANNIALFDRQSQSWRVVPDTRGMTAYHTATAQARALLDFAQPTEEETLAAPPAGIKNPVWDGSAWQQGEGQQTKESKI